MTDGLHSGEVQATFTERRLWDQIKAFFPHLSREAATFASVAISCWALSEILIAIVNNRPSRSSLAIPILTAAAIAAFYRAFAKYRNYVPEALHSESRESQVIFRKQRFAWQWSLAKEMLSNRIERFDAELLRIQRGAEFIEPRRLYSNEYFAWLNSRPETIIRLLNATAAQCTSDLPAAIGATTSERHLAKMKIQIEALAVLYQKATIFERECHAIVAPEEFGEVHEMTYGWTDTIREGIREFIGIATELANLDKNLVRKGLKEVPEFKITFEAPKSLDEFSRRLARVDPSVLIAD